jgi:type IV pilus assembly protein PilQ
LKGSTLAQFFRFVEEEGIGETVARPSITVRSGLTGNIQIGSDFPIVVRDFSGNSITNFISTGIIIDVTPTVIVDAVADTAGAPLIEFIHLDAKVERSSGRPFNSSVAVDRSGADTEILLLDNEATIIGGLFSTDETQTRRGIPILKDLPGWFFGLRYIFGTDNTTYNQRELLIVLRARILDPLSVRAQRALPVDLRNRYRDRLIETLENFDQEKADEFPLRPRNQ